MELKETFQRVKAASKTLGLLSDEQRNEILQAVADALIHRFLQVPPSHLRLFLHSQCLPCCLQGMPPPPIHRLPYMSIHFPRCWSHRHTHISDYPPVSAVLRVHAKMPPPPSTAASATMPPATAFFFIMPNLFSIIYSAPSASTGTRLDAL